MHHMLIGLFLSMALEREVLIKWQAMESASIQKLCFKQAPITYAMGLKDYNPIHMLNYIILWRAMWNGVVSKNILYSCKK